ncbi:MAG: hypothetical protein JXM69_07490 [Anaerolineae bacterium]|nr:hypothetical protein [Anaerolineae bacterium]
MERKSSPPPLPEKLVEAVARDYARAEVRVSFPDNWQLVQTLRQSSGPRYLAGFPPSQEPIRNDHFSGLPPEINRCLTTYRLYKLFEPRPTPVFEVAWNSYLGEGRLIGAGRPQVHLYPRGQAQIWRGEIYGVLWDCYLTEQVEQPHGPEELAQFWQAVEEDMAVSTIFTLPLEPAFGGDYPEFLRQLGYAPTLAYAGWWSKQR